MLDLFLVLVRTGFKWPEGQGASYTFFLFGDFSGSCSKFSLMPQRGEKFIQMCDPECYLDLLLMQKIKPVPFQTFCRLLDKTLRSLGLFISL